MVSEVVGHTETGASGDIVVVEMVVGPNGPAGEATNFNLFGASNDPEPSSNTASIDSEPTRPSDSRLHGSTTYSTDETFTIDVTFDQGGGPKLFRGTVPASEMEAGKTYRIQLVRVP